jgi:hypothetical protein
MAYVSVDVDIDMDDIDTDDLVDECCRRLRKAGGRKSLSDNEKKELKESFAELGEALSMIPIESIEVKTLDDKMKYEHLAKVFNKYNSFDIERLLPE